MRNRILVKSHLKRLYRTGQPPVSRRDFLRLDMNEGVSGLPRPLIRKILSGIGPEYLTMYPEYGPLIKSIARRNGLNEDNICLAAGSDGAIKYIFDAYVGRGDTILVTDPTFAMYTIYSRMFDAALKIIKYRDDLSFPFEEFIGAISRKVKLAVIVNPNNPTGSVLEKSKMLEIIKRCDKEGVLLVIDEAYFYFYPVSFIRLVRRYDNIIVLRTFSKLCGIASLRLGYAAACPEITENLKKVKSTYDVNGIAVLFGERIMRNGPMIRKLVNRSLEGKAYLERKLAQRSIGYKAGHANFILIRCGDASAKMVKALARKSILVQGPFRQSFLKDYIRVTIGDKVVMERFWRAFLETSRRFDA